MLLLGTIGLVFVAFCSMIANTITEGPHYKGWSPLTMLIPVLLLIGLYVMARRRFTNSVIYILLGFYLSLGTLALYVYGYALPEGLLAYVLVIILTGILVSARAAFIVTLIIMICLSILSYLQLDGIIKPDLTDQVHPLRIADIVIYLLVFTVILLVTWLSNRDIEQSLKRARKSEAALRKERNSLEIKVFERTRELERAQVEKMLELHRFAEFGRMSSALLHDIASPLTAVSLNLEQMGGGRKSELVEEARKGIAHMERYVIAARRQLQYQTEIKTFAVATEIRQVVELLASKAAGSAVHISLTLDETLSIKGDTIQFDHIISNLIANAIDAYEHVTGGPKQVSVIAKKRGSFVEIDIHDDGIGISAKDLKHVFEAFYTTKDHEHGTGIGLAIVKEAVERDFLGTIKATSTKRSGTHFIVQLPRN